VVDGPGWSFVRKFDKHKDGRGAVLALKTQAEGTSAKITRKQSAYASITSSAYHGPRKGFTFANYVTLHQAAHNELLDLDESVAETKKVSNFLRGSVIQTSLLQRMLYSEIPSSLMTSRNVSST
jgi:hypothetical protein